MSPGPPRRIVAAIRLIHPFPVTVVVLTTLLLVAVAHGGNPGAGFLARAGGVVLLSQIAVGALNDYVDRHHDAVAQPEKPIPSNLVPASLALGMVVASLALLLPLALSFGAGGLILTVVGTAAGLVYDLWLKPTPYSVTMYVVGFLTLVSWVWLIAGTITLRLLAAYPLGALLLVAAHLAQSFPDVETDRRTGQRGLAAVLGAARTFRLVLLLYLTVAAAGLAAAIVGGSAGGFALIAASLVMPAAAWLAGHRNLTDRGVRKRLFHILAPGIGLLGLGCLVTLGSFH
ncbi:MAG: UbiA family prenyltransferase [Chloroflexi bacterium]|nr:UbiA family prenyltransferase [Chloroflexota bacterium]